MRQASGKPSVKPVDEADLLPPFMQVPTPNLRSEIELPSGIENMPATIPPASGPPSIVKPVVSISESPLLVVNAVKPAIPRLTAEEREQFRLWKNWIVFGFLVAVLVLVFWALAR